MFGEGVLAVHDHGERLAIVGLLERRSSAHQHVQDHAERPDVWKKFSMIGIAHFLNLNFYNFVSRIIFICTATYTYWVLIRLGESFAPLSQHSTVAQ